ncbi:hypothetical protein [Hahella ganghwensis]|uniref:hypothetical protein n=1 Tax=Hahella ganghwensis TaxID=286420 RepID=UPI00035CF606|nr:hypothetical protein [Hahella ganghwensis]
MKEYYRRLLEGADEDGCYEFPSEFNGGDVEKRARAVFAGIQSLMVVCRFEGWMDNQDASFGLAIILDEYSKEIESGLTVVPIVRFSNFGSLATITFIDQISSESLAKIQALLSEYGFHYIPEEVAHTKYDGVMKGNPAFPTWWVRYFDWI